MNESSCLITCMTWVKRGLARNDPIRADLDASTIEKCLRETESKFNYLYGSNAIKKKQTSDGGANEDRYTDPSDREIIDKYGLDDYDTDDNSQADESQDNLNVFMPEDCSETDPYMTSREHAESDDEDIRIDDKDNLLITGVLETDASLLYIYVYNEEDSNLYVHHEILLPAQPLDVEFFNGNLANETCGNYAAVGSMHPVIDIWDVDVIDTLEPVASLGHMTTNKKKKSSKCGHRDAVLGVSWNQHTRKHLASCSADRNVIIWDLNHLSACSSFSQHQDKVQCVDWSPCNEYNLLSGSFDHTINLYDTRQNRLVTSWTLDGEIEKIKWDASSQNQFYASTDTGHIAQFDVRQEKPTFCIQAHESPVIGLDLSIGDPCLLLTGASDGSMKSWNVCDSNNPQVIMERKLKSLNCVKCSPDSRNIVAVGGRKKPLIVNLNKQTAERQKPLASTSNQDNKKRKKSKRILNKDSKIKSL